MSSPLAAPLGIQIADASAEKTTIAGKVKHEVQCTPVENAETNHLLALRAVELQAPKAKIKIEGKLPPTAPMNQADEWKGFVVRILVSFSTLALAHIHGTENHRHQALQGQEDGEQDSSLAREPSHRCPRRSFLTV